MIAWVMILFGLWLVYLCVQGLLEKSKNAKQAQAAKDWASATGNVVSLEIVEGQNRSSETQQVIRTYRPEVTYSYTVGGKEFKSSRIAFGKILYYQSAEAEAFKSKYGQGAQVPVFYDPAAPDQAVLDRDPSHATKLVFADYGMMIFGLVLLGIGLSGVLGK